ncbi:MAG: prolyl oligopeptidase family serine peptidase [Janthinobacterium lividum]
MRAAVHGLVLGCLAFSPALAAEQAVPSPVTETLWGRAVTDTFRGMEALDPATLAWMEAQGERTRAVLDSIAPRAALEARVAAFTASLGFTQEYATYGGRAFFEERAPGADSFDLVVADAKGRRTLVDVAALRAEAGGTPMAINYILPAPDGSKVAVGISAGGSEDASIWVYDAATGARIAGPVDRAEYGATTWRADSAALYFIRLKRMAPGEPDIGKYQDPTLDRWDMHGAIVPVLGRTVGHGPAFDPVETPSLEIAPGAPMAAASSINGVQNELAIWLAPAAQVDDPQVAWTPFVARSDDVSAIEMRGDDIFVLSHHGAPTFQVLSVRAGRPLSEAAVLLPARAGRVVDSIHAASDALYVLARSGAYSQLLRIPTGSSEVQEVALPFRGHIDSAFADPRAPGLSLALNGWVVPPTEFAYDPQAATFRDLALTARPALDPAAYVVQDLDAKAADGTMVPLSLVQPRDAHGPQVTLVQAYGSYGISELADFSTRTVGFLREGGSYASCHVRGGGELGDAWRLAGKDALKPNTWRDLIACAEDLVARGVTTPAQLFIFGGSAGGITVGRAMTERPDLFAGVIDAVPAANTLRAEFSPNGPPNVPEFGSVATEEGFRNLFEMDTLQHVVPGTQYPAVLITTGLNDPRVSPWEPAKLAATLQASGTTNPVLLRIDREGGHGIGSTRSQGDALAADIYSFVFWRAGRPGWAPQDAAATH